MASVVWSDRPAAGPGGSSERSTVSQVGAPACCLGTTCPASTCPDGRLPGWRLSGQRLPDWHLPG